MPFIILDRDGVINYESEYYIKSPDEWHPIPGSLEAIAQLNRAGFRILIATNQSGVGRGYYDIETLDKIHEKLSKELAMVGGYIEEFFFCPHHPKDQCGCRKPKPGLFHQIQKKYDIDFSEIFYVGDSLTDLEVAKQVGCKPILVLTGNGEKTFSIHPDPYSFPCFANLAESVKYILTCP